MDVLFSFFLLELLLLKITLRRTFSRHFNPPVVKINAVRLFAQVDNAEQIQIEAAMNNFESFQYLHVFPNI